MLVQGLTGDSSRSQTHRDSAGIARHQHGALLRVSESCPARPRGSVACAVAVAQEKDDHVVIDSGLKAGDDVVSVGALILDQMFDNAEVTHAAEVPATFEVHSG